MHSLVMLGGICGSQCLHLVGIHSEHLEPQRGEGRSGKQIIDLR